MRPDHWDERLEAYLDHELPAAERAAFESEVAVDPERARALAARRELREAARRCLGADVPAGLAAEITLGLTTRLADRRDGRRLLRSSAPTASRWPGRRPVALAAAAAVAAAVLVPALLLDRDGGVGVGSGAGTTETIAGPGQVVAVRFGESPGATVVLEACCYDRSTGTCH